MWKTTSDEFKHASIRMNSILLGKLHQVSQNMLHSLIRTCLKSPDVVFQIKSSSP
jgi:hypothetical protein